MCGILGVVLKNSAGFFKQTEDAFFEMLYADAVRGWDSTGIIGVEKDTTFHIAKEAVSAEWFISQLKYNNDYKHIVADMWSSGKAYIGHNRKRTVGEVKDETAHPFVVGDWFAMVHNGTLYNHEKLAKTAVDSEALAIHLAKTLDAAGGDQKKLKGLMDEALGEVNGAYALAMYDQRRHRLYLLRNKERPLSMVETENAIYFMSEPLMGGWVLSRNGYHNLKAEHLSEHQLVTFDLDTNKVSKDYLFPKKSYTPSTTQHWGQGSATTGTPMIGKAVNATALKGGKFMSEEKDLKRFRKGWLGKRISFWADDFLEKNFPLTIAKGETEVCLMGGLDEIEWRHSIFADIDMDKLGLHFEEDLFDHKWTGVIESVSLTNSGFVHIHIAPGCKPLVDSLQKKATVVDLQTKVDAQLASPANQDKFDVKVAVIWRAEIAKKTSTTLHTMYEENKHRYATWQKTAINAELAFRAGVQTVEQAQEMAKKRYGDGFVLTQKVIDNRFVYVDDEGKIFYESAVTVH